jgi:hypothetical protein
MSEWIPACPPINRKGQHNARMANEDLSVRDRQVRHVVIPPPLEDEQIPVAPPAQRRQFVDPNARGGRPVRRD